MGNFFRKPAKEANNVVNNADGNSATNNELVTNESEVNAAHTGATVVEDVNSETGPDNQGDNSDTGNASLSTEQDVGATGTVLEDAHSETDAIGAVGLGALPLELICAIAKHLLLSEIAILSTVCRHLNSACEISMRIPKFQVLCSHVIMCRRPQLERMLQHATPYEKAVWLSLKGDFYDETGRLEPVLGKTLLECACLQGDLVPAKLTHYEEGNEEGNEEENEEENEVNVVEECAVVLLLQYLALNDDEAQQKALNQIEELAKSNPDFGLKELDRALKKLAENYNNWGSEKSREYWQKDIGGLQYAHLPNSLALQICGCSDMMIHDYSAHNYMFFFQKDESSGLGVNVAVYCALDAQCGLRWESSETHRARVAVAKYFNQCLKVRTDQLNNAPGLLERAASRAALSKADVDAGNAESLTSPLFGLSNY